MTVVHRAPRRLGPLRTHAHPSFSFHHRLSSRRQDFVKKGPKADKPVPPPLVGPDGKKNKGPPPKLPKGPKGKPHPGLFGE